MTRERLSSHRPSRRRPSPSLARGARVGVAFALVAAAAVVVSGGPQPAAAADGTIELTDLTAPNIIGDSNVTSQPDDGPDAFMIATEYCNNLPHPLYDVTTNVGTWGGTALSSSAGEFEDTVVPVGLYSYDGTFDLDMVPGTGNPETRYLGQLDPGECIIINTIVSYDVVDANGKPVWGASNSNTDDLVYDFDYWATWLDPGPDGIVGTADDVVDAVAGTDSVTVRNEITAAANKIGTSTVIVEPDTSVAVGETVSITYDGVNFGLVNQGFDADGDGNPDYDIWFQAIGEAGLWDPDVFQLVGVAASVFGTGCGGGRPDVTITSIDTTYFKGLDAYGNCGWTGAYTYTFVAISEGSSTLAPYQETASGSDNEKYNNDYCGDDPDASDTAREYCPTLTATGTDLELSKSVAPEDANPGDTLTWSVNLVNPEVSSVGDPDAGFGVVVEDAIPAGVTYVSGSAACGTLACQIVFSTDGGTSYSSSEPAAASVTNIRWLIDEPVIGGTDDTVTFQTTVDPGTSDFVLNLAGITIGGQAPSIAEATAAACIGGCAELAIDKDTTTPTAVAGGTASYTILVENDASAAATATGVVISDTLPTGFTYAATESIVLSGTASRPTVSGPTSGDAVPTWGAFDLAAGDSVLITFTVNIGSGVVAGTYHNTATASAGETVVDSGTRADDGGFPVGTDPETDDDVTVNGPDLTVDKDTSTPQSVAGGQATYQIVVANGGSLPATGVTIRDNFPSIWTYASSTVVQSSATRTATTDPTVGASIATWGSWTIDPGGSVTIVVVVDIPATALDGTYDNTTSVSAANHLTIDDNGLFAQDADTPPGADPETDEDVTLRSADVSIVKSDRVDPVPIGQSIVYDLLVVNNGPLAATGVVVTDTIAATSSFISATSTIGTCSASGGVISCNLGDMASGTAATITVTVNDTNATVVNAAIVTTTSHDGNPANDSDIEFTTITTAPVVKASDAGGTVVDGQTIGYTVTINNTGATTWTGIAVSDPLPAGTSAVAGSTSITKAAKSTASDDFASGDFSGGTGWNEAAWVTFDGAAVAANEAVLFDGSDEARRSVDLSGASSATLNLDYTSSGFEGDESVTIEVSDNGTDWTVLQEVSIDAVGLLEFDLTPYRSATTYVRVIANDLGGGGTSADDQFAFDNVVVTYNELSAGVPGGDPADLIVAGDGYTLAEGEFLTITYQVVVDDPIDPAITQITNTATLTATGLATSPEAATVTDLVLQRVKIGDLVWFDTDGDGVKDVTEPGIDGVTVNLYLDDGDGIFEPGTDDVLAGTQITSGGGAYDFVGLDPGSYWVDVDDSAFATGTVSTTGNDPLLVAVAAGADYNDADFGYRVVTDLSITKVDSADPVADSDSFTYTIEVTNNGPADATNVVVVDTLPVGVTFDSVGSSSGCLEAPAGTITCTIGALAAGADTPLTIVVDVVAGTDGTITNTATVTANEGELTPADNTATEDTVVYIPATISDRVWYDVDGDGNQESGEPGISKVTVRLYDATGTVLLDTQVTGADGLYSFVGLAPGTYTVVVDNTTLPDGMTETYDVDGTGTPDTAAVSVVSDQTNATTDFGYTGTGSIGDFVFVDVDGDGVLDVGETTGIAGAEIELTWAGVDGILGNTDDYVFTTQTTLADGAYDFTNLPQGTYEVDVITEPVGYVLSTGNDPLTVTLAAAEDDNDVDFGYYQTVTIGDEVWVDLDGDGINDAGEPAYEGMDVTLIDLGADGALGGGDDTTIGTVTTGATGAYSFTGVAPGQYAVVFDPADGALTLQDQGADEALDSDADATTGVALVTVVSGIGNNDIDAGVLPAVIGDTVWVDLDADGVYDSGTEPGLAGATVNLYEDADLNGVADGAAVATTTTGTAGDYSFTVVPGSYLVEVVSAGSTFTTQGAAAATAATDSDVDAGGLTDPITVASGQTEGTIDAGVLPSVIGDLVWLDVDGDGVYESGSESGFDGVTVNLIDAADGTTVLQTATTSGGGLYSFTVAPGAYIVEVVAPAGYGFTVQDAVVATEATDSDVGVSGRTGTITVSGTTTDNDIDAGLFDTATIGDLAFDDVDGDGVYTAGTDTPLAGVTVTLYDSTGTTVLASATTLADGLYSFSVLPGTYVLTYTPPSGYVATVANVGGDDALDSDPVAGSVSVDVADGLDDTTVDAGFYTAMSIGDFVYYDIDGDGAYDALVDVPLEGVTVTLTGTDGAGNPVSASTKSDANGAYSFDDLVPGVYTVAVTEPSGMSTTDDRDGTADGTTTVTAVSGTDVADADFGLTGTGTIGDQVFEDVDNDGMYTSGTDVQLSGVTVTATWVGIDGLASTSDDVVLTTTTDSNGEYSFPNLPAGSYTVDADQTTTGLTSPIAGTPDPATVTLIAGEVDNDVDFGYYETGSIADLVWDDLNGDGIQNTGEPGVENVTVTLTGPGLDGMLGTADDTTTSTTTNATGLYSFSALEPGAYSLEFDTSTATGTYVFTQQDQGADDAFDSDVDPTGTVNVTVLSGTADDSVDAGVYQPISISDFVWVDADGDGIQDGTEPGLDGVTVVLLDGTGAVVATDVTSGGGLYSFDNLAPGDYELRFVAPAGYVITAADIGGNDALDSDADPITGETGVVTYQSGDASSDVDAGVYQPATIGDSVFEDLDADGLEGAGEGGLTGIQVVLIGAGTDGLFDTADDVIVDTRTTDDSGTYLFADVAPGTYRVSVNAATVPAGYTGTTTDPRNVVVGSGDSVTIADFGFVPPSGLSVTKDPDTQNVVSGGDATFTVTITNSGGTELTNIVINDPLATCVTSSIAALVSGASVEITCTTTNVTADFTNTVDVTADSPTGTLSASATADVVVLNPSIAVVKDPATQDVVAGGDATFTVKVTNDGETALTNVVIDDPLATCDTTSIGGLAVGADTTVTCTTTGVSADFTNTVTVTADDPIGTEFSATDSAEVVVLTPDFLVTKDPAAQDVALNGTATFTVTIENTGETVLAAISIDDPLATCDTTSITSLAVGASATVTCTTTGVAADFTNTVTVTADDPIGTELTRSDTADVTVLLPGVSITKGPATQFVVVGDTAMFDITVTNTGALDLVDVTVSDPLAPACNRTFGLIPVGGSESYTCSQVPVTVDYVNEATVEATDSAGNGLTDADTAAVDVIDPSIEIQKTPDLIAARAGDTVTFTITVTNTGDVALTNVVVTDPLSSACDATFASLGAGAIETYTCDTTATADFTNTATVTADEPAGGTVGASDTADVDVIAPAIGVTKSPATQKVIVNGTATFGISITNLGDSELIDVIVSDPLAPACDATFASLAVGETQSYSCTLSPVAAAFTNTVTVSADDQSGQAVSAVDTAEVTVVAGALDIQKSPNLQTILQNGVAAFGITVTNGGSLDLFDVVVTDPSAPGCGNVIGTLVAGSSLAYGCTLSPVPNDFTNTATVTAVDAVGNVLSDIDSAVVDVIVPAISVSKTPDVQTVVVDGTATFTIEVTNDGDAELTDVVVTDPVASDCDNTIATLAVGETVGYSCTLSPVASDFTNTVDVVADEPSSGTVTASDTADVVVLFPAVEIQKTPDYQITGLGGDAEFTITITNSGETDLVDVVVSDPSVAACNNSFATLAVGVTVSYTCAASLVAGDFINTAAVTADDPLGNPVTDSDTAAVDLVDPGLSVSKTPDLQTLLSGETASFTIDVTNTGDIGLTNVVVSDPNAAGCNTSFATLAVGVTETVSCTVTGVLADFVNTVTVTADNPVGATISVSDDAAVDVVFPGIEIQKTPDIQQVLSGDDVTFTITVTNTGTEDLINVVVSDPSASVCDNTIGALAAKAVESYDCVVTGVVADFTNIAAVSGEDASANPVSDSDDAAVDAINPSIAISNTPDTQTVVLGGTPTFTIEITNTGDVELTNVVVSDLLAPDCDITVAVLAPGETHSYTCTQPDVTVGFTNTVTVTADDPLLNELTASDGAEIAVLVPAVEIQKSPGYQQVTVGELATFTITVTNSGQTPLSDVVISDPFAPACGRTISSLAVGATTSYTCTLTVSGDLTNTASVTADDPLGNPWTDSDTADVDAIAPSLFVTKSPDVQSVPLGSLATFTIEVANDGDVDLTDITITDPSTAACNNTLPLLAAGTTWSYTCDAVVTVDFTNTVFVTGLDPFDALIDGGSDTADVTVLLPGVLVEKTPDAQAIGVGQDATFTITVTNIGDVGLTTIGIVDVAFPVCDKVVGPLSPGASTSYNCTVPDVLTAFTNVVEATAADGNGNIAISTDDADVTVLPASITIAKIADSDTVIDGDDITYTITLTNDGPADLFDVTVTDATLSICGAAFATLLAGAVETYTCTQTAVDGATADPVVNTINVTADDEAGTAVTDSATETVDVLVPALSVFKTAVPSTIVEGDDATFEITVINTGDVPLTDVAITDAAYPACDASYATLAIGEVQAYSCSIFGVIDDVVNTVDAIGTDPIDGTVTDSDSATVTVRATGVLTGFVFTDEDGDGVYEPADGDAPIANLDIVLTDDVGNETIVVTDVNGVYTATLPIGDYTIDADTTDTDFPAGYPADTTGTNGQTVTVADDTPVTAAGIGFGQPMVGSVTGIVWHDVDADGVLDAGESEISGVALSAVCAGSDGVFGSADDTSHGPVVTASPYVFSGLPVGACVITIDPSSLPANERTATSEPDLVLDGETTVTVISDTTVSDVDFGFVNLVPLAVDDSAVTDEGVAVTIPVVTNDTDPEDQLLTVNSVVQPFNGTAVLNADGTVTYTPAPGFDGIDSFTYTVCDPAGECSTATVTVTVRNTNTPPRVLTLTFSILIGQPLTALQLDDLEGNGPYAVSLVSGTLPTGLTLNNDGSFTGTVTTTGVFTFTVEVCDRAGACARYPITVTVTGSNIANTGASSGLLGQWAMGVLLAGVALVAAGRRRVHVRT